MINCPDPVCHVSIVVASYKRPRQLLRCLSSLSQQTRTPDEVLVVKQGDDQPTATLIEKLKNRFPFELKLLDCPEPSIVGAINRGIEAVQNGILFLCDDDSRPPAQWISQHLKLYRDPTIGAVGGVVRNFSGFGKPHPIVARMPIGRITWFGRVLGFHYDHPFDWAARGPIEVDHLHGGNMSLRRKAIDRLEEGLRSYWQCFEVDACLTVKESGFRVLFDFSCLVNHYPARKESQTAEYFENWAYNESFVLSKHSKYPLRTIRFLFTMFLGSRKLPGLLCWPVSVHNKLVKDRALRFRIFASVLRGRWQGWLRGARARASLK